MKTLYKTLTLALILIVTMAGKTHAQTTVSGIVADAGTKKAIPYVSVSIRDKNLTVKAGPTNTNGTFKLENIKPGTYAITFVGMNYQAKELAVDITTKTSLNLDTVYLNAQANNLKEVTIKGNKPLIKQEADRISYDIEADPDSKANTLLTMMRKVPLLSVDGDDNVLLKGKNEYKVFINGRPSPLMDRNLKQVLRSMPASSIQRIEVITNPPAKYDAEGLSGIINIITAKKIEGYKGSINLNGRYPTGGPGLGSMLTLKRGKFGLTAFGGAALSRSPEVESSNYRVGTGTDKTALRQDILRRTNGRNGYLGTDVSYDINDQNLVTAQLNINRNTDKPNVAQHSILNGPAGILEGYDMNNTGTTNGRGWDAAINYQLGFKKNKNKLLTFSYRYSDSETDLEGRQDIFNRTNYKLPNFIQTNNGSATEQTMQVDYVQLVKKVLVEAGIKGILRKNKSDFTYSPFNQSSGLFEADPAQSNFFNNDQNIFGAYNSYQFVYKKLEFKTGFRMEQTVIDADFISNGSNLSKNYFNLIPTISVNKKLNAYNSLSVGFSQRIKRPGINKLNPFVDRTNPSIESSGNPDLKPALINAIQLNFSSIKKATINLGLDYSFVNNFFLQVSAFDPVSQITRITYQNTGKASGLSANLYVNYPVTKALGITLNGNGGFNKLEGMDGNVPVKIELFTYNLLVTGTYGFTHGWRANANVNVMSQNISSLQGRTNALVTSSFGINKDLVKNKLYFAASVNNPFTKYRDNITEVTGTNFLQTNLSRDYFRTYSLSLNYNFGKLSEAIKKNKRGIKNDDLSN